LGDLTLFKKFTTAFGAVCRTDVKIAWVPHAHRKTKQDKRMEYLNFLNLGVLTWQWASARPHTKETTTFRSTKQFQWV